MDALDRAGVPAWAPGARAGSVRLVADDGPARATGRSWRSRVGVADVVVGTRAAAFAPVARLGLAVCWDDGDPLHAEPRAPYPHAREVLALRAEAGLGAAGRRVRALGGRAALGRPRLGAPGGGRARRRPGPTPRAVHLDRVELAREGPAAGARLPVRRVAGGPRRPRTRAGAGPGAAGGLPAGRGVRAVPCVARCAVCAGPLRLAGRAPCQRAAGAARWPGGWRCAECGHGALRSVAVGAERTAEELGRAFPGVTVRRSSAGQGVLASVPGARALVVATPGAEPVADGGYAAAVLLDAR